MKYQITSAVFAATQILGSAAHLSLAYPPPYYSQLNPTTPQNQIDYWINSPLNPDGSNFPCKGMTGAPLPFDAPGGAPQATWAPGQAANFSIGSGAMHNGGSCQISLTFDQGKTFTVIHSYIGHCPMEVNESFDFNLPQDTPTGNATFMWTWYNNIGNHEIYASCAAVTIEESNGATKRDDSTSAPAVPFAQRPSIFIANLENGCTTVETEDVIFPAPGPDFTQNDVTSNQGFTGTCGPVKGVVSGETSDSTSTSPNPTTTTSPPSSTSSPNPTTTTSPPFSTDFPTSNTTSTISNTTSMTLNTTSVSLNTTSSPPASKASNGTVESSKSSNMTSILSNNTSTPSASEVSDASESLTNSTKTNTNTTSPPSKTSACRASKAAATAQNDASATLSPAVTSTATPAVSSDSIDMGKFGKIGVEISSTEQTAINVSMENDQKKRNADVQSLSRRSRVMGRQQGATSV